MNGQTYKLGGKLPAGIDSIKKLKTTVGYEIEVATKFGVVVTFDGVHRARIMVPTTYNGCVDGKNGEAYIRMYLSE